MYLDNSVIKEDLETIYRTLDIWEEFDGKTVFITGAYGMISSYIVFFLMYLKLEKNIDVYVVAQGRDEKKAYCRFCDFWNHRNFEFINTEITSPIVLDRKIDYIIHGAGIANPTLYNMYPVEVIEPNAIGTYYLLQFAKQNNTSNFLLFSTGDVYGKVDYPENIVEETVGKIDQLDAHSCYGESKRLAETLCVAFTREYNLHTNMVRIAHTYGPTMDIQNDPRTFAAFMKCALNNEDIVMQSDGSAKRPFCYISDAVFGYLLVLLKGKAGEAYNVCNVDGFISIKELAYIISKLPKNHVSVVYRNENADFLENPLNVCNLLNEEKMLKLGWRHTVSAEQGFRRTYEAIMEWGNKYGKHMEPK